jgi:hypothetical protein
MIAALLLAGSLLAQSGAVYDANSQPQGSVKESRPGTFDLYDRNSERVGTGKQSRPDGPVEIFDRYGRRVGEFKPGSRPASPARSGGSSR